MNFIDKSYFDGEIYLPAVSRDAAVGISKFTQSAQEGNLDWYISIYEEEYLKKLLGKIYPVFMEEILLDSIIPRRDELLKKIYQTKQVGSQKVPFSPAAYYIYYNYMVNNRSETSHKGEVRAEVHQTYTLSVTPAMKLSDIWNRMSDLSTEIQCWIIQSHLYDDVLKSNTHGTGMTCYGFHFMADRFCFEKFRHINAFSI